MVLFSVPLSIVDREIRQKKTYSMYRRFNELCQRIDLIYNGTPNTGKNIIFLKHNETLDDIKHMLAHNTSHKFFFKMEIVQSIILKYDGIKL